MPKIIINALTLFLIKYKTCNNNKTKHWPLKNKNAIIDETNNKLRPVGSKSGTLYGSAKVHKPLINGLPPFRPILSVIGSPTYKLAKLLVPFMPDITQNELNVKDSFTLVDEICTQNSNIYMAS